jgi:RimJ/RimL family protein N-acetyltransferase
MMDPLTVGAFTLRLPSSGDVVWLCDSCRDREVQEWTRLPKPYLPRHAIEFVEAAGQRAAVGSDVALVIELTDSGELLGVCGLMNISDGGAEIGYWLAPDGRGRGAATSAARRLVTLAGELNIGVLRADIIVGNERSERVLERCLFTCVDRHTTCEQRGVHRPATRWERRLP